MSLVQAAVERPTRWGPSRWWELARDALACSYIVFYFHEAALQVVGGIALPVLIGIRLPGPPGLIRILALILMLGAWRWLADPTWRSRLRVPDLHWLAAASLLLLAGLSYHALHWSGPGHIRDGFLPFVVFWLFLFCGVTRRRLEWTLIVCSILNSAVTIAISLFWLEPYRNWMALVIELAKSQGITLMVTRDLSRELLVPTGLIVSYIPFGVFHLFSGSLLLNVALQSTRARWLRLSCAGLSMVSLITIFLTLDRSNTITALAIYSALLIRWYMQGYARRNHFGAGRMRLAIGAAAIALCLAGAFIGGGLLLRSQYQMDVLSMKNLSGTTQSARFVLWGRIIDDISRQHGWLTGIRPEFRMWNWVVPNSAPAYVWSEHSYYTIDNWYLSAVVNSGLFGMLAMMGFFVVAGRRLKLEGLWCEFSMLLCFALIFSTLESNMMPYVLLFMLAGSGLGDTALARETTPRPLPVPGPGGKPALALDG